MPLPELTKKIVDRLLADFSERVPPSIRHQVYLSHKIRGESVTLVEHRIHYKDKSRWTELPVAQFRHNERTGKWTLYWRDRNLRWHIFEYVRPTTNLKELLAEVDRDQTGIFWG